MLFLYLLILLVAAVYSIDASADRWRLDGKKVLVTGGTKGIGREVVRELCSLGADVITCSRNTEELEALESVLAAEGYKIKTCTADVSSAEGLERLIEETCKAFDSKLDCLINNVGMNIRKSSLEYLDEEIDKIFNTNLRSTYTLCMRMHPLLVKAGGGSIVNIGSIAGGNGFSIKSGSIYAMTKAAMNQLTMNLSCEWAADSIRVNCVCPWYIRTPLVESVLSDKEKLASILQATPLGRVGEVDEVSGMVTFLCMKPSSFTTGQCILVDGGMSRQGWWP